MALYLTGMSHVREARMLCRKTVNLFTLFSHTQETGSRRMGMTQELLALVTGLAHYLKILIRIALIGALKLEREQSSVREAMASFLDKLHLLAVQGGDPTARRVIKGAGGEALMQQQGKGGNAGTMGVTYGFKSLAPESAGESPFASNSSRVMAKVSVNNPPSDLCVKCNLTVEEDCVRLGTYQRWHSQCIQCKTCGKVAAVPAVKEVALPKNQEDKDKGDKDGPKLSTARRPPANVGLFVYEVDSAKDTPSFGDVPTVIFCTNHGHPGCRAGFYAVSRLEQYAFLLNVALRRLYLLLKKQGVVPLSPGGFGEVSSEISDLSIYDMFRCLCSYHYATRADADWCRRRSVPKLRRHHAYEISASGSQVVSDGAVTKEVNYNREPDWEECTSLGSVAVRAITGVGRVAATHTTADLSAAAARSCYPRAIASTAADESTYAVGYEPARPSHTTILRERQRGSEDR
jgi:hypothetical protein